MGKGQPWSIERQRVGKGLITRCPDYPPFPVEHQTVVCWARRWKKRPNLTLAMSPLAVKGTSHPGWGPFFTVTQKDNVAYVSRSLAMVSATQVWAPLLLANHLETRQVAARRERVQEIWEGGCRLGRQHEHRDPFQPKVTSEGEAALCTWQGQACCGKAWAASGLFFA